MATCTSCGNNVSGKKFCPECGTSVQPAGVQAGGVAMGTCPRCQGEVKANAAFCMHCGGTLSVASVASAASVPATPSVQICPSCQGQVPGTSAFCTSCGYNMRAPVAPATQRATGMAFCTNCGRQNDPDVRFCGGCGSALGTAMQAGYAQTGQSMASAPYTNYSGTNYPTPGASQGYAAQGPYQQGSQTGYTPSQLDQSPYAQTPYPQAQSQSQQYGQPYQQQGQYGQPGYQPQPMLGQQPMVLRCPTCMAMSPMGTPGCPSCRTSLAGVVPTPANMMAPGQQQQGGFLQGNAGKFAIGALGGAAAIIGGEMLLDNITHHNHREEEDRGGGGLFDIAKDIGLF